MLTLADGNNDDGDDDDDGAVIEIGKVERVGGLRSIGCVDQESEWVFCLH